jgi:predicted transposase YbfD/YdcC
LHREGVVCAQQQVEEKTNEINAVVPLFAGMDLEDTIVTADAMHAQKKLHAILLHKNMPIMS